MQQGGAGGARRWLTLGAMCMAMAMTFLDATILNVALPAIQSHLKAKISDLQWVLNAYTLAVAVLIVTGGRFGDLFGRKRVVLFGVALFTVGSAICGAAQSIEMLIGGRAVQGLGGAMLIPGTLSIITQTFDGPERGTAIGIWSGVSSLAIALGPVLGGVLVQTVSWESIFWINIPFGVFTLIVGWYAVRESRDETASQRIDAPGVALITLALLAISLAFIQGNEHGWTSAYTLGLMGGGAALLCAFVVVERRVRAPLLTLSFFRSANFTGANAAIFACTFSMFAYYFMSSLYLQDLLGYTALEAGVRLLPQTLLVAAVAPFAGRITDRFGPRNPLFLGMLSLSASLFLATRWTEHTSYAGLLPSFVMSGVGQALVTTPVMAAVMAAVPRARSGAASGVVNTMRQVGGLLGVAALGALFGRLVSDHFVSRAAGIDLGGQSAATVGEAVASSGLKAVARLPDASLAQAHAAATSAFVDGFSETLYVNASMLLLGAIVAVILVRKQVSTEANVPGTDVGKPAEPERAEAAMLLEDAGR